MYFCELCDFKTENRNNIEEHHIIPKELNGSNKPSNLIKVCGNCHAKIYIKESTFGIHSIKTSESILIKGWFQTTARPMLLIEKNDKEQWLVKKNI